MGICAKNSSMMAALQREWGNLVQPLKKADTSATYPYGAMNFIAAIAIRILIANS
jgi:hypothetical protein